MEKLGDFDRALLNLLQGELPICPRPFATLAEKLHVTESVVLSRVQALKAAGFLRRIGTFFDSANLGYQGTLVALSVEQEKLPAVAECINRYPGATHNYEREGRYNLWFTLLTRDKEQESAILGKIRALPGVRDMLNLKANKKYKVNVQFRL